MQTKRLNDGTFLVAVDGDDIDANHWHITSDGTVLSIKEGGSHAYNRGHLRRKIDEAIRDAGIGIAHGWRP